MASLSQLIQQRNSLQLLLSDAQKQLAYAQTNTSALVPGIQSRINQIQADLAQVNIQIAQLQGPSISAGTVVNDDAYATVDNSSSQHPILGPLVFDAQGRVVAAPDTTSGTNARPAISDTNVDIGTNGDLRPLTQTQSTQIGFNNQGSGLLSTPPFNADTVTSPGIVTTQNIGVGAQGEDAATKNSTRAEIDNVFTEQRIIPQANVLDQYASYTYVISVYLMTLTGFQQMVSTGQKNLSGAQLLFQSGGGSSGSYGSGRSPYFSDDYYIDRVEFLSTIQGKGTGAAHNVATIKMNVIEPNGITLLRNLDLAVQSFLGGVDKREKNYQAENYLMTVRFYGYDSNGNLVRGGVAKPDGSSDPNAFIEKFYPMRINNIKYRIANKLVEYEIEATPSQYDINVGSNRGTIPYNLELAGGTVKDALAGPAVYSTGQDAVTEGSNAPPGTVGAGQGVNPVVAEMASGSGTTATATAAPPKADAAPTAKSTIKQGLMGALNGYQAKLVKDGIYNIPDQYEVEFVTTAIESAKIKRVGTDKNQTANSNNTNVADQKLGSKQSVDFNSRNVSVVAGTQIVQAIDKILRNSTYLEDQQIVKIDESTQKEQPNGSPGKNVAWYKISMRAVPIAYDSKRNDYAYKITYIISAYKIAELISPWFQLPSYSGTHKQYKYWFTGENTQVLSYEIDYKSQYSLVMSGGTSRALQEGISNANVLQRFVYQPRSDQNSQGAKGRTNEPAANAADYFYNPGDLGLAKLTIVGDPAWLQQGEAFAAPRKTTWKYSAFLPDGTINFDSQEVLFEVAFNAPADYNLQTGLIDPNSPNYTNSPQGLSTQNAQSFVYKATQITSEFNKGKFTQNLQGVLMRFTPEQIAAINNQTQIDVTTQALVAFTQSRVGTQNFLNGITALPFASTLTNSAGVPGLTQAAAFGINALAGSVLGSVSTRPSTTPTAPTSFGLAVGRVNLNTINPNAGGVASLATPPYVPSGSTTTPTVEGITQVMAGSDDQGNGLSSTAPGVSNEVLLAAQGPGYTEFDI